eukprot:m.82047 g.82047  ORF g.82047 m.82047 type:complete len:361 (-) comp16320_c1_seq15:4181-5263(-)
MQRIFSNVPWPSWLSTRMLVLCILTLQTAVFHVTLRVSRSAGAKPYSPLAAVTYTELLKLLASIFILSWQESGFVKAIAAVLETSRENPKTLLLLTVPAILYTVQNTLVIYAISYLSAVKFSVARQIKIPVTGFFSVMLLKRELGFQKWLSIFVVTLGVAVVQLARSSPDSYRMEDASESTTADSALVANDRQDLGLVFALLSCVTSGLASVWFEMLIKRDQVNLWVTNVQLASMSALVSTACVLVSSGVDDFYGFDRLAVLAVSFSASDGLVIALVMKYADNILKGFATSVAICFTAIASVAMGDIPRSDQLAAGCLMVVAAVLLYSTPQGNLFPQQEPRTVITFSPKVTSMHHRNQQR